MMTPYMDFKKSCYCAFIFGIALNGSYLAYRMCLKAFTWSKGSLVYVFYYIYIATLFVIFSTLFICISYIFVNSAVIHLKNKYIK